MGTHYTVEFKAEAVRAALEAKKEGQSISAVARNLGVKENSLHRWVQMSRKPKASDTAGGLTVDERQRLRQLERENRVLKMERDILKKATAFFAKENA